MSTSKLYIANCTKQHQEFRYWLGGNIKLVTITIRAGGQQFIEMEREHLQRVISDHRKYGFVEVKDISNLKVFSGLCFQYDKPINIDQIGEGLEKRDDTLEQRSQDIRTETAAAIDISAEQIAEKLSAETGTNVQVGSITTEVQEVPREGSQKAPIRQTIQTESQNKQHRHGRRR